MNVLNFSISLQSVHFTAAKAQPIKTLVLSKVREYASGMGSKLPIWPETVKQHLFPHKIQHIINSVTSKTILKLFFTFLLFQTGNLFAIVILILKDYTWPYILVTDNVIKIKKNTSE